MWWNCSRRVWRWGPACVFKHKGTSWQTSASLPICCEKYWVWDPVSADFHLFVGRSLLWWSLWPSQLLMGTKKTLFFFYSSSRQRTGFPSIVHTAHSGLGDVYKMLEICCKVADLNVYVLWCLSYWGKEKKGQATRESITKTLQNELKKDVGFAYISIPVET